MAPQTQHTAPDWLAGISAPLPEVPCGKDPRYLEEFEQIKEEIDKLRDVDYGMIKNTCRDLLTRVTKDLRIGGYLLTAGVYTDGMPGLLESLMAYRVLLENFWEECHPKSENGRLSALNLLSNPKIMAFAEQKEESGSFETFQALKEELEGINAFLIEKQGEEVPRLSALAHWVGERAERLKPADSGSEPKPGAAPEDIPAAGTPPPPSAAEFPGTSSVESEQKVENMTRQIHKYLMGTGDFLQALSFSRAFRWGKLTLPPNEDGKTRIPSPRASGLVELKNALAGDSVKTVLACCESLFFEPGFHLLFDLQFKVFEYMEDRRRSDLAGYIRHAMQELLQRRSGLAELSFDDGTPFAGPECRQWIQQWESTGMGGGPLAADPEADEETAAMINAAMKLAKQKNLTEALGSIRSLPAETEKQRVRKRLTEAGLCLAAGKAPMAEVVLEDLQNHIQAHHLATWDPNLAVEVLRQRLAALQLLETGAPAGSKENIAQQGHEVRELICKIDVAAAAALI
jgi:type VI secretion system protein VasJ